MYWNKMRALLLSSLLLPAAAWSHCQVPCGIYDDGLRISALDEHITTMDKSMTQIVDLSADADKNFNQIVRWINTKDHHSDLFIEISTIYFMLQRLKPVLKDEEGYSEYQQRLELLHRMIFHAMKCKQTTDKEHIASLRQLLKEFEAAFTTHSH